MFRINQILQILGFILLLSILLSYSGFINGYPIIYHGDSAGYVEMGINKISSVGTHSIVYSIFITRTANFGSFWVPIFIQSILLAISIFLFVLTSFRNLKFDFRYLILFAILPLVFFTGLSKYPSKLIPDVFTPILILNIITIANSIGSKYKDKWLLILSSCIFIFSFLMQTSNFLISIIFLIFILFLKLFVKRLLSYNAIVYLFILIVISGICLGLTHYKLFGKFYLNKASHVVLMARFSENGTLLNYLKENCEADSSYFCSRMDFLPGHSAFLYDSRSPMYPEGFWDEAQWEKLKPEIDRINKEILLTPKYVLITAYYSFIQGFRQFFLTYQFENRKENLNPFKEVLTKYYPDQVNSLVSSGQYNDDFEKWENNVFDYHLMYSFISFLLLLIFFLSDANKSIVIYILTFLAVNALVCGGLVLVHGRYQERVFWVLPFFLLCHFISKINKDKVSELISKGKVE